MRQTPGRRERRRSGPRGGPGQGSRSVERTPLPQRPSPTERPAASGGGRAPLPANADALPPLDRDFGETLDAALDALQLELTPGARTAVEDHVRLLLAWNRHMNLTAIRTPDAIALEHVADSLAAAGLIRSLGAVSSLLDLGSGGGYPGLPLAVALPVRTALLVDATAKKARFLEAAAATCRAAISRRNEVAPVIETRPERAEDLARGAGREQSDLVVARGVAPLAELVELALPLMATGGWLVAWKRDAGDGSFPRELAAGANHAIACGGRVRPAVESVPVKGLEDHRLVVVEKLRPTPQRFPRAPIERRRDWPAAQR